MRGEKIETSTDLKFNPQAKDANHSLIMCVCVCVCVYRREDGHNI